LALWVGFGVLIAAMGCVSRPGPPDLNLAEVWRDYRKLPGERALAISGNIRQDRFVAGAAGGAATMAEAEAAALRECATRRLRQRQQAACEIYAIGDEIVWPGP
jgi:hypothetical protein